VLPSTSAKFFAIAKHAWSHSHSSRRNQFHASFYSIIQLFLDEAVSRQDIRSPERVPLYRCGLRHQRPNLAGRRRYLLGQFAGRDHGVLRGWRIVHAFVQCRLIVCLIIYLLALGRNDAIHATIEFFGRSSFLVSRLPVGLPLERSRHPEVSHRTLARGHRQGRRDSFLAEGAAVSTHVYVDSRSTALQVVQLLVEALQFRRCSQQDSLVVVEGVQPIVWTQPHVAHAENRMRDYLGIRISGIARYLRLLAGLLLIQHRVHQTLQIRGVHLVRVSQLDLDKSTRAREKILNFHIFA